MLGYILIDNKEKMKYQIGKRYEFKIGYVNAIDDFDYESLVNIKNCKIIKIKIFDSKKHISNDFKLIKEIDYNKFINSNNKKYQILSVVKNHERKVINNFIKTNDIIKLEAIINSGIHEYLDFLFNKYINQLNNLTSKNDLSQIEYMNKLIKNNSDIEYNKNILSMMVNQYGRNKDIKELILKAYCLNDIVNIGRPEDLDILIKTESQTIIDNVLLNGRSKDIDKYINSDDYLSKKTIIKTGIDLLEGINMTIDIYIMMGLPGSGKTTYCETHAKNKENIVEYLGQPLNLELKEEIYIDGLILTNKTLMRLIYEEIEPLKDYFSLEDINIKLHIVYFKENRKQCLINDKYRMKTGNRNMLANHSIENRKFEYPNVDLIKGYNVDVVENDIYICHLD